MLTCPLLMLLRLPQLTPVIKIIVIVSVIGEFFNLRTHLGSLPDQFASAWHRLRLAPTSWCPRLQV